MPVLDTPDGEILFVHIPKTGGSSVEAWLGENGRVSFLAHNPRRPFGCSPQHFTWRDIQFLTANKQWRYAFSIIRCPYARMESEFAFRFPKGNVDGLQAQNFGTWMENAMSSYDKNPYALDNHLRPQVDFLAPKVKVFRFEDGLDKIMAEVSADTGIALPTQNFHVNKRLSKPSFDWSTPLLMQFNAFYKHDFEALGYDMRDAVNLS